MTVMESYMDPRSTGHCCINMSMKSITYRKFLHPLKVGVVDTFLGIHNIFYPYLNPASFREHIHGYLCGRLIC